MSEENMNKNLEHTLENTPENMNTEESSNKGYQKDYHNNINDDRHKLLNNFFKRLWGTIKLMGTKKTLKFFLPSASTTVVMCIIALLVFFFPENEWSTFNPEDDDKLIMQTESSTSETKEKETVTITATPSNEPEQQETQIDSTYGYQEEYVPTEDNNYVEQVPTTVYETPIVVPIEPTISVPVTTITGTTTIIDDNDSDNVTTVTDESSRRENTQDSQ